MPENPYTDVDPDMLPPEGDTTTFPEEEVTVKPCRNCGEPVSNAERHAVLTDTGEEWQHTGICPKENPNA